MFGIQAGTAIVITGDSSLFEVLDPEGSFGANGGLIVKPPSPGLVPGTSVSGVNPGNGLSACGGLLNSGPMRGCDWSIGNGAGGGRGGVGVNPGPSRNALAALPTPRTNAWLLGLPGMNTESGP